jgi:heme-degrading monooxygenase HmoA
MFIAMNRFQVPKGSEQAFEELWLSRETHLDFHLLEGPAREDHVLYSSHTILESQGAFEAWTPSESLPGPGRTSPFTSIIRFEGFTVLQEVRAGGASSTKQDS